MSFFTSSSSGPVLGTRRRYEPYSCSTTDWMTQGQNSVLLWNSNETESVTAPVKWNVNEVFFLSIYGTTNPRLATGLAKNPEVWPACRITPGDVHGAGQSWTSLLPRRAESRLHAKRWRAISGYGGRGGGASGVYPAPPPRLESPVYHGSQRRLQAAVRGGFASAGFQPQPLGEVLRSLLRECLYRVRHPHLWAPGAGGPRRPPAGGAGRGRGRARPTGGSSRWGLGPTAGGCP